MFLYQTRKRDLYYDRVIELYLQTGFGKKRLSRLIPEVDPSTIRRWIANFVAENPQVASMNRTRPTRKAPVPAPGAQSEELPKDVQELQAELQPLVPDDHISIVIDHNYSE